MEKVRSYKGKTILEAVKDTIEKGDSIHIFNEINVSANQTARFQIDYYKEAENVFCMASIKNNTEDYSDSIFFIGKSKIVYIKGTKLHDELDFIPDAYSTKFSMEVFCGIFDSLKKGMKEISNLPEGFNNVNKHCVRITTKNNGIKERIYTIFQRWMLKKEIESILEFIKEDMLKKIKDRKE